MNVLAHIIFSFWWFSVLSLFPITAAGVVSCGGRKKSPRTSYIVHIIVSFWSFEIASVFCEIRKLLSVWIHFLTNGLRYLVPFGFATSLCINYPVERCKITVILFGSMLPNL